MIVSKRHPPDSESVLHQVIQMSMAVVHLGLAKCGHHVFRQRPNTEISRMTDIRVTGMHLLCAGRRGRDCWHVFSA